MYRSETYRRIEQALTSILAQDSDGAQPGNAYVVPYDPTELARELAEQLWKAGYQLDLVVGHGAADRFLYDPTDRSHLI